MRDACRQLTIGDLCDAKEALIQTGPFGSQLHQSDYVGQGVRVVATECIGHRRLRLGAAPCVAPETATRLNRHRLKAGDILFARRGAQATGYSAIVEGTEGELLCSTGAILLRLTGRDIDPRFLSFLLAGENSIEWLRRHAVGVVMPNLNETVLRAFPLDLPSLGEQRAIARVLGALDDKIELNRRMNRTLEELAGALFRAWFVDFEPVVAKAAGRAPFSPAAALAALFPAAFTDSELGPIPHGWRVATIGDIADNPRRQITPSEVAPEMVYIGLEHMPRKSICLMDSGTAADVTSGKSRFAKGEILFGKLRPYFHKVGVALCDGVCSTDVVVVTPKAEAWFGLLLGHLSSDEFIDYVDAASGGTRMPRTSWHDMKRHRIALPPEPLGQKLTEHYRRTAAMFANNREESRTLAALRDTLLPKLLSGELRVKDAEKQLA